MRCDESGSVCPACTCPWGARRHSHTLRCILHLSFLDHMAQVESSLGDTVMRLQWVFPLSEELQSPGMKEPELMGEMITCHGYKNGWSSEDSLRGNWREIGFSFSWNHFKIAQPIFYFEMKCCVSSLMVLLWVGLGLPEAYRNIGVK